MCPEELLVFTDAFVSVILLLGLIIVNDITLTHFGDSMPIAIKLIILESSAQYYFQSTIISIST